MADIESIRSQDLTGLPDGMIVMAEIKRSGNHDMVGVYRVNSNAHDGYEPLADCHKRSVAIQIVRFFSIERVNV